jgi:hypothetical protein
MLDRDSLPAILCSGYSDAGALEDALKSHPVSRAGNLVKDAETFFQQCSEEEYYRFFRPLHPRHPCPYYALPHASFQASLANISMKIDLLDLKDMTERANTVEAKFRITASWQPALLELRMVSKTNDGSSTPMASMSIESECSMVDPSLQRDGSQGPAVRFAPLCIAFPQLQPFLLAPLQTLARRT